LSPGTFRIPPRVRRVAYGGEARGNRIRRPRQRILLSTTKRKQLSRVAAGVSFRGGERITVERKRSKEERAREREWKGRGEGGGEE